jgi:hypothetical protein
MCCEMHSIVTDYRNCHYPASINSQKSKGERKLSITSTNAMKNKIRIMHRQFGSRQTTQTEQG